MVYAIDKSALIRFARESEVETILYFIRELAAYEKMEDQVHATGEDIRRTIFIDKRAEVLFCEHEGRPVGFALFFHNYSTFLGSPGLYLEDLYIEPQMRGRGYGKAFFSALARIAKERRCGRIEWWCLDWNKHSIDFYLSMGAEQMSEWTVYRLCGEKLNALAGVIDQSAVE